MTAESRKSEKARPPRLTCGVEDEVQPSLRCSPWLYATEQKGYSGLLHPLTDRERLLVSEKIRLDITEAAADALRHEQLLKARLHTVHIKCVSLLILALCAIGYAMIFLQGVLVPFTLAIFFMFLLEPLLFGLLHFPVRLGRVLPLLRPVVARMEEQRKNQRHSRTFGEARDGNGSWTPPTSPKAQMTGTTHSPNSPLSFASAEGMGSEASDESVEHGNCGDSGRVLLAAMSWRMWSLFSVLLCLGTLLGVMVSLVVIVVRTLNDFPIRKYEKSDKLRMVLEEWFPHIGADPENLKIESFMPWLVQGFLVDAVQFTFTIVSMVFLTLLFLAFLLASDAEMMDSDDFFGLAKKVRTSVRAYIRIKTWIAFVVAFLVGLLLWVMEVDLAILFGILTFLLSYIPHVGYTIAVLAPLPLVFLDPTKDLVDLVIVFTFPFILHQFASNLIEPKLLASSLDLHPIVVLIALAFWATVWGAVGAILSVPLTAVLRLILLEVDHPYTRPIVNLLKGRLRDVSGPSASSRNGSPKQTNDSSPTVVSPDFIQSTDTALMDLQLPIESRKANLRQQSISTELEDPAQLAEDFEVRQSL